jgi:hypothetical protein
MSRLTGTDALGLMEAYQAVYAPRELTEEQVWEEVELWVSSLVEEGYDLSDYTWDDLYEYYVSEAQVGRPASTPTKDRGPGFDYKPSSQTTRPDSGRFGTVARPPYTGGTHTPQQPRSGTSTGSSGGTAPASRPTSTPASRPTSTLAPRPTSTPAPRPTSTPASRPATASTTPAVQNASSPRTRLSADELRAMRIASIMRQQNRTLPGVSIPRGSDILALQNKPLQMQDFDPFDVIQGHLIDEGYADTEEAALVIMSNMSEDWIQSIVEGLLGSGTGFLGSTAAELGAKGGHDVLPWNQNTRYTTTGRVRRPGENIRGERILNDPNRGATTMRMGGPVPQGARVSRQTPPPNPYLQGGRVGVSPAPVQRPRTPLVSRNVPKPTGGTGGSSGRASTNYGRGF